MTEHYESFDGAGLPGFEFLQDELDYETRTHDSNLDTVDHLRAADLEQAAIVEAIFLWNTAEREAMMPRKPFPHPEREEEKNAPVRDCTRVQSVTSGNDVLVPSRKAAPSMRR